MRTWMFSPILLILAGCGAMRQEVSVNLSVDPAASMRVQKMDVSIYLVR
jgi:hypothetical protein